MESQTTGWPTDTIQEQYDDHASGWDHFLPRLGSYVDALDTTS